MSEQLPLLFLHGFPLHPGMWQKQIEHFSVERKVFAPDLRLTGNAGNGGLPEPVTMERMAEAAVQPLETAGIRRFVTVGFSMGGYVAFALQRRYPERVAGLVLADTKAEADSEEGRKGRESMAKAVMERGSRAASEAMVHKLLSPATIERRPELTQQVNAMILDAAPEAIASASLGMAIRDDMSGKLSSIRVPVLVIVGEDDAITPPEGARKMAGAFADGEFAVIGGAGHLANMENPSEFNRILSDWLRARRL